MQRKKQIFEEARKEFGRNLGFFIEDMTRSKRMWNASGIRSVYSTMRRKIGK
jgi:hypothetical protein